MYVKASGLFVMGTKICGYVCQRVEEGSGIMEDGERVVVVVGGRLGPPPCQTALLEEQPHWLPLWSGADMEI